jgi:hypothetical protein
MSEYRLTERQVDSLNLIPVTWQDIRRAGAETVYIRAHSQSPTYGPYKVKDPSKCIVCKLDGTDPRYYPRDKGLFVSQFMKTDLLGKLKIATATPTHEVILGLAKVIIDGIEAQQKAIVELITILKQRSD